MSSSNQNHSSLIVPFITHLTIQEIKRSLSAWAEEDKDNDEMQITRIHSFLDSIDGKQNYEDQCQLIVLMFHYLDETRFYLYNPKIAQVVHENFEIYKQFLSPLFDHIIRNIDSAFGSFSKTD